MTLSDQQLADIRARETAATAGPWRWRGNTEVRRLRLQTPHHGGLTVMDFTRWGMQGARPRFARDGIMHPADETVVYAVAAWSKDIYRKDVVGIDHPDAQFMAHAREDVPALLAELDRVTAELGLAQANLVTAKAEGYRQAADNATELVNTHGADADAQMLLVFLRRGASLREQFAAAQHTLAAPATEG